VNVWEWRVVGDGLGSLGEDPLILRMENTWTLRCHGFPIFYSLLSSLHSPTPMCFDQRLECTQTSRHRVRLSICREARLIVLSLPVPLFIPSRYLYSVVFLLSLVRRCGPSYRSRFFFPFLVQYQSRSSFVFIIVSSRFRVCTSIWSAYILYFSI
jgi:hypothetical protein